MPLNNIVLNADANDGWRAEVILVYFVARQVGVMTRTGGRYQVNRVRLPGPSSRGPLNSLRN